MSLKAASDRRKLRETDSDKLPAPLVKLMLCKQLTLLMFQDFKLISRELELRMRISEELPQEDSSHQTEYKSEPEFPTKNLEEKVQFTFQPASTTLELDQSLQVHNLRLDAVLATLLEELSEPAASACYQLSVKLEVLSEPVEDMLAAPDIQQEDIQAELLLVSQLSLKVVQSLEEAVDMLLQVWPLAISLEEDILLVEPAYFQLLVKQEVLSEPVEDMLAESQVK